MSLLEQNTNRKRQVNKNNITKLDAGNNEGNKYKMKAICNSAVYIKESTGYLLRLYYLVFLKNYLKKENI